MPKKNEKRLASDPFDRFLPQIGDSRKKKDEDTSDGASESADVSTSKDASKVTSNDAGKSTNIDASTVNGASDGNDGSKSTSNDTSNFTGASKDKSTDADTSKDTSTITSNDDGKSKRISAGADASNGDGESAIAVTSGSTITIARRKVKSALVKMTYYLRPDQVQAIDELHDQSGRDKSELVRMALDVMIDRARVE